jgi:hypothetical protein
LTNAVLCNNHIFGVIQQNLMILQSQPETFCYTIKSDEYRGTRLTFAFTGLATEAVYKYLKPIESLEWCEDILSEIIKIVKSTLVKFGYVQSVTSSSKANHWTLTGPISNPELPTLLAMSKSMCKSVSPNGFDAKYVGNGTDKVNFKSFDVEKIHDSYIKALTKVGDEADILYARYSSLIVTSQDIVYDVSDCYLPLKLTFRLDNYKHKTSVEFSVSGKDHNLQDLAKLGLVDFQGNFHVSTPQAEAIGAYWHNLLTNLGFDQISAEIEPDGVEEYSIRKEYSFPALLEPIAKDQETPLYFMDLRFDSYINAIKIRVINACGTDLPEYNIFGTTISSKSEGEFSSFLNLDVWPSFDMVKLLISDLSQSSDGKVIMHQSEDTIPVILVNGTLQVNRNHALLNAPTLNLEINPDTFVSEGLIDLSFEGGSSFDDEKELVNSFTQPKVYVSNYWTDSKFRISLDDRYYKVIPSYEQLLTQIYALGWEILDIKGYHCLTVKFGKINDFDAYSFEPRQTFAQLVQAMKDLENNN